MTKPLSYSLSFTKMSYPSIPLTKQCTTLLFESSQLGSSLFFLVTHEFTGVFTESNDICF